MRVYLNAPFFDKNATYWPAGNQELPDELKADLPKGTKILEEEKTKPQSRHKPEEEQDDDSPGFKQPGAKKI